MLLLLHPVRVLLDPGRPFTAARLSFAPSAAF